MSTDPTTERLQTVEISADFRHIVDTLPAFVWCAKPDGSIAFLNRRGLDYTGFSLDQITGWNWTDTDILHPDDTAALFDAWNAIVASGREGEIQARMRRFDGEYRWFLFRVSPLCDAAGALAAWWGVDIEIDAQKRTEEQLREALADAHASKELLAGEKRLLEMMAKGDALTPVLEALCLLVQQSAPGCLCGILLVDPTGTRLHHGAAPSLPPGYNAAIHGRPIDAGAGPCGMAAVLKEQVIAVDVACDTRWDGYEWGALAIAHGLRACWSTPITSSEGAILGTFAVYWRQPSSPATVHQTIIERMTHLAAIAIERERSEDALNEVRSDIAHVARVATLGEMTASIAHEINQPLGAIVNNANATLRWLAANNAEEAQQSVALIVADGHRASEILARIRAMVQKSPLQRRPLDLNDAIREVLTLIGSEAEKHGVSIERRLSEDIPRVRADRVQMQQVVLNLVMNAIEAMSATPDGLRRITVDSRRLEDATVLISVCDRGPGFNPDIVERLFEAFYSTKPSGLGMGLAISRGIVTAHDGHLWATSNADGGATFQFTLPVAPVDAS